MKFPLLCAVCLCSLALPTVAAASESLSQSDRKEILRHLRRWVRFAELPTSPVLRAVYPQLPRWVEVAMEGEPSLAVGPSAHRPASLKTAYADTRLAMVGGANARVSLVFHSPAGARRVNYSLDWCQAESREAGRPGKRSWSLARVTLLDQVEGPEEDRRTIATSDFYELARVRGGPLRILRFGTGDNVTLMFAAIHGDERNTGLLLEQLAAHLRDHLEDYAGCTVILCPCVSPEGWKAGSRPNAQGIDANRNFSFDFAPDDPRQKAKHSRYFRGLRPLETPEALALQHLVGSYRPDKIVAVHCPFDLLNYDGPAADLAQAMHEGSGQGIAPSLGYPTPGSFGTYAGLYLGIPTITLELPEAEQPEAWPLHKKALLQAIRFIP